MAGLIPKNLSSYKRQITSFRVEDLNASWGTPVPFIPAKPLALIPRRACGSTGRESPGWDITAGRVWTKAGDTAAKSDGGLANRYN